MPLDLVDTTLLLWSLHFFDRLHRSCAIDELCCTVVDVAYLLFLLRITPFYMEKGFGDTNRVSEELSGFVVVTSAQCRTTRERLNRTV